MFLTYFIYQGKIRTWTRRQLDEKSLRMKNKQVKVSEHWCNAIF